MRQNNIVLALLTAVVLAACGGGDGGNDVRKPQFSSQITFGDSLSDVGTYAVGTVKQLGGGRYTINGDNTAKSPLLTGKNYTELLSAQFGLPAPCAAQTGLDGLASQGFSVPVVNNANCFNYAQGGARVSNPVGPSNKLTGSVLGQMTVPLVSQVANHLVKAGGSFKSSDMVIVMAGGNDALFLLAQLSAEASAAGTEAGNDAFAASLASQLAAGATNPTTANQAILIAIASEAQRTGSTNESIVGAAVTAAASQPGNFAVASPAVYGPMVQKAQTDAQLAGLSAGATYASTNGPKLVTAMATAGAELAALVKTQIVAKGANHVIVNNLPDLANTPAGKANDAQTQALINAMVSQFNSQLLTGLADEPKILHIDIFAYTRDQIANPARYGLSNTSTPACGPNQLGTTSLVCTGSNVIAADVSRYMFADTVHPTPYENSLIAGFMALQMMGKGWF